MNRNIEISPYGSLLVYKKGYTLDFVRSTIIEKHLRGLRIFAHLKDDRLTDLDFLSEYTFLEVLDIASVDDYDFGFLSSLKDLKDLSINIEGKNSIDLGNQESLESLTIQWRKGKISGLEKCQNITSLCLVDFKEDDFLPISSLGKLGDLKVKTASIKTIKGVEDFSLLETLLLGNCKALKSINDIGGLQKLSSLNFELCPKIEDYNPVGNLSNLESLQITDCKGVNTIRFVQKLSSLKKLMLLGNTDILDGDMTSTKNIKEVIYKHRKHYNIKIENKENDRLVKSNLEKIKGMFK